MPRGGPGLPRARLSINCPSPTHTGHKHTEPGKDRQGRYGKEVRERAQERRRLEIVSRDGRNIVTPNVTQLESALEGKI